MNGAENEPKEKHNPTYIMNIGRIFLEKNSLKHDKITVHGPLILKKSLFNYFQIFKLTKNEKSLTKNLLKI